MLEPSLRAISRYHTTSVKKKSQKELGHNFDVLYNVMLQCKTSNPGKEFVRAVAASPEPMAVLATNHQLDDMVRFLTDPVNFSIMDVEISVTLM